MDWGLLGWIITSVLAVAAIVVTVFATRRWGTRRARAQWFAEVTPLLAADTGTTLVEVRFQGVPVKDPALLTFGIANIGPLDVTAEMFDGGRPIRVELGVALHGITQSSGGLKLSFPELFSKVDVTQFELLPRLLKRGEVWSFSAVVAGRPKIEVDAPLSNTDLKHVEPGARSNYELVRDIALAMPGFPGFMASMGFRSRH